jgi:preprotein translocase subunit SecF
LALFALFFLGGEVIHGFAFAMLWGVFVGTYSSIFIAAPLLLILGVKRDWSGNIKQTD